MPSDAKTMSGQVNQNRGSQDVKLAITAGTGEVTTFL